ncbi:MAG TPA: type II toxin-antitoxin system HicB family antitoxin [Thermoanaerobaculia bacterium]|nr:type II toxin-antitoxin system HicB family antitoxin [Thermoanaerobaculia bacterium]
MYKFLIVIERAPGNFSAYPPGLPGCVATGETREEVEANMYEAIKMHIEGLRKTDCLSLKGKASSVQISSSARPQCRDALRGTPRGVSEAATTDQHLQRPPCATSLHPIVLKGRDPSAWGIAPGIWAPQKTALKGRDPCVGFTAWSKRRSSSSIGKGRGEG